MPDPIPRRVAAPRDDLDALAHRPRRRATVPGALAVMLIAFVVAGLLGSGGLVGLAERQDLGWRRSVALGAARTVDRVANALSLNRPADLADEALGRTSTSYDIEELLLEGSEPVSSKPVPRLDEAVAATTTTTTTPSAPVISPARPLRLYVGGDSMSQELGDGLVNVVPPALVTVSQDDRPATGLARPDVFDWTQRLAEVVLEERPDAVVLMFGANDNQNMETADGVLDRESQAWIEEYRARVAVVMDLLDQPNLSVTWVGQPIVRSDVTAAGFRRMNRIYAEEAAKRDWIDFVDSWSLFADAAGNYAKYLPDEAGRERDMRQGDGIHLSIAGSRRLARAVWPPIALEWAIPRS